MTNRLSWAEYFLNIMEMTAERATCPRRKVGCVLVDADNHIVSTGFNGVPRGFPHCTDEPCEGASYPSGQGLEKCLAIHAEVNALLQLAGKMYKAPLTAYLPVTSCINCAKIIANTDIKRLVVRGIYPHPDAIKVLETAGVDIVVKDSDSDNN